MDERLYQTILNIAYKHGLKLHQRWEFDVPFVQDVVESLEEDSTRNPQARIVGFLESVTREVEADATTDELAEEHGWSQAFAATMHDYALKQIGYENLDEGATSLRQLKQELAEDATF